MRTARSRISGEYLLDLFITPSSQEMGLRQTRGDSYRELNKYGRGNQGNNISGWIDWFTTLVYNAIVREMVAEQEIEY